MQQTWVHSASHKDVLQLYQQFCVLIIKTGIAWQIFRSVHLFLTDWWFLIQAALTSHRDWIFVTCVRELCLVTMDINHT